MKQLLAILVALCLTTPAFAQDCAGGCCESSCGITQHRWNDERICMIDGATGAHIELCGKYYILSCAHLTVERFMQVGRVGTAQSHKGGTLRSTLVMTDEGGGLGLWSLPGVTRCKTFAIAAQDAQPRETVRIAGFPMGRNLSPRNLLVTGRIPNGFREDAIRTADRYCQPGESGSPITNTRGELCGIFWGSEEGYSCYCSLARIRKFLRRAEQKFCPNTPPPSPPQASEPPAQPNTPTIDVDALDQWRKQLAINLQQRDEKSLVVLNDIKVAIENQEGCQCEAPDFTAINVHLAAIAQTQNKILVELSKKPSEQPATGSVAPAVPQIHYYDIVPRKK